MADGCPECTALLLYGAFLPFLLIACGGGGSSGGAREPAETAVAAPAAPPAPDAIAPPRAAVDHLGFTEISLSAGLEFTHGFTEQSTSAEVAAGAAVGDYNNDGWLDLYLTQGDTGVNKLFENRSLGGVYSFQDVASTVRVAMAIEDKASGPALVDFDGDGDDDLFVGGVEYSPFKVFRNEGAGAFTDISVSSGLAAIVRENSISMAFGDYDQDRDLDLFIGHWTFTRGELRDGNTQYLWRNNGDGTFTDVSDESLVSDAVLVGSEDFTFTPNFADIDSDGDPDLLIVADNNTSQVLINNGDQGGGLYTFTRVTDELVITDEAGMGASVADFDHDGDLDWFVSSIAEVGSDSRTGNRYYENDGNGVFSERTDSAGVREGYWGWAACAADFNNDGHLDIFHVNGIGQGAAGQFLNDPSRLFIANGDGSFTEFSEPLGLVDDEQGRGVVCFDGDQDGDIDVLVANNSGPPALYRNDGGNSLNYLNARLVGQTPNMAAVGARIYLSSGGVTQMREISSGNNYVSQNPLEQHFGLNDTEVVTEIRVVWPDGSETRRVDVTSNQRIKITHPDLWSTDE